MVGDDAVRRLLTVLGLGVGQLARGGDQRLEGVGVVIVVHALQDGGDPLQPHAGVDRLLGQFADDLIGFLLELHEDQVPDLDESVAVLLGAAGRAAIDMVAVVIEDFGARTARPVLAHRPEIVLGRDADDLVIRQPGNLLPQGERLVIGVIDGRGELVGRNAPDLGQQGPGMGDRLFLEIVAEREIAQHFKEGMVPRGIADIVEIVVLAPCPHAFLRTGCGRIWSRLQAGEHVLERHHARIHEHQRRIVLRHERRGGHDLVPLRTEIVEKAAADVVGRGHGRDLGEDLSSLKDVACRHPPSARRSSWHRKMPRCLQWRKRPTNYLGRGPNAIGPAERSRRSRSRP